MPLRFVHFGARSAKIDTFDCGVESLNLFVRERAAGFIEKGLCAVTLLMDADTDDVYGVYAISPFSIDSEALREEQRKYYDVTFPIPAWKIGVLAVEKEYQRNAARGTNKRYGSILLQGAIRDIQNRARGGAGALIFVDAINRPVKRFYKKFGFCSIPNTSNQMARSLHELPVP